MNSVNLTPTGTRYLTRLLAPLAGTLMLLAGSALAQDDAVVLRVDDRSETVAGFNDRFEIAIRNLVASMGLPMDDGMRAQLEGLKPEYLDQLARDLTLLNEAERRGITVSDDEIALIVDRSIAGIPEEELDAVLESAGFNGLDHITFMVRETEQIQLLIDTLYEEMEFSDDDLQAWFDINGEQFAASEQVCAAHILVDDQELAADLLLQLQDGADFAELAVEHSTDPGSGRNGGDLGCFGRGMMVAPFEETAFSAEPGEVAGPVESQFGHHLILVSDRIEAGEADLADFREQAEIGVANERIAEIVDALVEVAEIETFPELLEPASEPAESDEPAGE